MHILISYEDGTAETVPVHLEGHMVSRGQAWLPGHVIAPPTKCRHGADFFSAALDEGDERVGTVSPQIGDIDPDTGVPDWQAFRWELVGSDQDECHAMLLKWALVLGEALNPVTKGCEYFGEDLSRMLSPKDAVVYDRDMQCCASFLDDAMAASEDAKERAGITGCRPSGPRR